MKQSTIFAMILLAIGGILLIGGSITGMFALSQSCCFGTACPSDYLCDAAEGPLPQQSNAPFWTGVALSAVAILYLFLHSRR